ncbi:hypothetical protein J5X98_15895 [Leptothermofonsia sichuanensis E412]|uniref:hypothetical protein n=1 Tax=Leptothermofonsia sichuanensis TaxID=2917832 RepID=UPI001CA6E396|nr:hypothetical protein [Leptothermofonsia sichuanensis]QZZ18925.1 hypothetical protein J5X98_15895 [Leptothermofonsia sichuanensis E412]
MFNPSLSSVKKQRSVKKQNLMVLGLLASAGLTTGTMAPASAQFAPSQPFDNPQNAERTDIFSNRGGNQSSGMMDIIHRAIQGQGRSLEEFNEDKRENIDSAAQEFLRLRQQRLSNPSVPAPVTAPVPATTTPGN